MKANKHFDKQKIPPKSKLGSTPRLHPKKLPALLLSARLDLDLHLILFLTSCLSFPSQAHLCLLQSSELMTAAICLPTLKGEFKIVGGIF